MATAAALFEIARQVLKYIEIPTQLEVGFGLALAGCTLVIFSLIFERIGDARTEGDLRE